VAIADMADRVILLSDGRITDIRTNRTRRRADELEW
jgi:putative ABC transport system ATP-binding protein